MKRKNLLLIGLFFGLSLTLLSQDVLKLPLTGWQVYYTSEGSFADGVVRGIPRDGGAALKLAASAGQDYSKYNGFVLRSPDFEAGDLAFNLRGRTMVYQKAVPGQKPGEFHFHFDRVPENLNHFRLYFNVGRRFSGRKLQARITGMELIRRQLPREKIITSLEIPKRRRILDRTYLLPRIQTKYDLMMNYLDGYCLGSGTFTDRPLFFDRTLAEDPLPEYNKVNSPRGFCRQLASSLDFTDGFAFFGGNIRPERFLNLVRYADEAGFRNVILMEIVPRSLLYPDKLCPQIEACLKAPSIIRAGGRLVVGSYHGEVFTAEQWRKALAPYRKKYGDRVMFTCEMRSTVYKIVAMFNRSGGRFTETQIEELKQRIRSYAEVTDGINFSGTNHLNAQAPGYPCNVFNEEAYRRFVVPILSSVVSEEQFRGRKLLGLSAHKVYCQVRSTISNVDEEGTAGLQKSLRTALSANPDFIIMPEWNEINENTHVEPTVSDARTNSRVINAIRDRKQPGGNLRYPNLVLSFRQENDLAAPVPVELLGLPDEKPVKSSVLLRFRNPEGKIVREFPRMEFSHKTIERQYFLEYLPLPETARWLMPELEILQGGRKMLVREGLPHVRFRSAPNQWMRYVKLPLRDLPDPEKINAEFRLTGKTVQVTGRAVTDDPMVTVELLADDVPLAAVDSRKEYRTPPGMVLLCWQRQVPAVPDYNHDRVRITALRGSVRARSPYQYSMSGMAVPRQEGASLYGAIGGRSGFREFLFYTTPDAVLEVEQRGEKEQVSVAEVLKNRCFRWTGPSVSWRIFPFVSLPEIPLPLDVKKLDFQLSAALSDDPDAVYSLRIITRAGQVYRSLPYSRCWNDRGKSALPVWNLLQDSPQILQVPRPLVNVFRYDFSSRLGMLLPEQGDCRNHDVILGGYDYWTHGGVKGWDVLYPPQWQKENGRRILKFSTGSCMLLRPPLFSRSAYELEMEVSFDQVQNQHLLDVYGGVMPVRMKDGVLYGHLKTRKGTFSWRASEKLSAGRYYRIRLSYDLCRFRIFIDGRTAVDIPASGPFADAWILCLGGAPEFAPRTKTPLLVKKDGREYNPGFCFSGKLRAFQITNCPGSLKKN